MKHLFSNIINWFHTWLRALFIRFSCICTSCTGDLATNSIGAIIIAVVVIGLLVVAINSFFPDFFTGMFESMRTKLNANW